MKILVISDTHAIFRGAYKLKAQLSPDVQEIWHLGDHAKDVKEISNLFNLPVFSVKGNCDPGATAPASLLLERGGYKIFLTHGHLYGVKSNLTRFYYTALEEEIDVVCFGHTHIPVYFEENNKHFFNPGSLSKPVLGETESAGIITIVAGSISFEHLRL